MCYVLDTVAWKHVKNSGKILGICSATMAVPHDQHSYERFSRLSLRK